MLNPVFAAQHLRAFVPLFHRVARQLELVLQQLIAEGSREVELVDWISRLAVELIAQGALGCTFDSLSPNAGKHEFAAALKKYAPATSSLHFLRRVTHLLPKWPRILRFCACRIPSAKVHNIIRICDIMHKYSMQIFEEKKALLGNGDEEFAHQLSEGKDIISLLMRENKNAAERARLSEEEIIGQIGCVRVLSCAAHTDRSSRTFLFAGSETTSVALSRILLLLAENPNVQAKLRDELKEAFTSLPDGEMTYEVLSELPYLDAVCRETLRVYPPVSFISRTCKKGVAIPLSQPIETSDGPLSAIFVPQGTDTLVHLTAINRSKQIWGADAEEWKPERFLSPLPESVGEAHIPGVYSNTMTFSAGGYSCIGFKFAELELKVVLAHLVRSFRFSPSQSEIVWKYGGLTTPSVKGSDAVGPKLPMVVERL
ncbi:cytochrome P450 [Artomyces pyxidatus]|uniref:Cytochrome P450 n=1 Tax=Artomyces pyxidatus TaxID=48021 RepID=A0ACB8SU09_9AGAM|nr:cytochrome P450 [Artomyces pyxidatus]